MRPQITKEIIIGRNHSDGRQLVRKKKKIINMCVKNTKQNVSSIVGATRITYRGNKLATNTRNKDDDVSVSRYK